MYAKADKAPIIYCLGVTEHSTGTEGVMSMSNMHFWSANLAVRAVVSTRSVVRTTYRGPAIWEQAWRLPWIPESSQSGSNCQI